MTFLAATASGAQADGLTVSDAWIRALPPSVPSGGYFTLRNGTPAPVTLTTAQSPACGMLMLHKSGSAVGMTSMDDVSEVIVPPGGTVKFSPGGYHLMCMEAGPAIKPGQHVPVTLNFRGGAKVTATFAVRNAAGK
ncbi:MAG TPA: copper chaperone PCu(A)C [Rhizomicrobium sp.]|nr:copper chaperone PCu(A)C [Rhizomicrobium sp.]